MQFRESVTINVSLCTMQAKERIFDNFRRMVRDKGSNLTNFKLTNENATITKKWGMPKNIFRSDV